MRTPNLGSVFYAPGDPSGLRTVEQLVQFNRQELVKIAAAITALAAGHLDVVHVAPEKPRDGDVRYADGTDWDPGGGRGFYYYNGMAGTWVQLG